MRQLTLRLSVLFVLLTFCGCGGEPDPVLRGCIKSTACNVKAYPRVADCLESYKNLQVPAGLAKVYNGIYSCVDQAKDCGAVRTCFGVGGSCDNTYKASCNGGTALFCDLIDHTTFTYDCGAHGLGCEVKSAGGYSFDATCTGGSGGGAAAAVSCGDGLCQRTGAACTSGNDFDRCSGDRLEACLNNEWVSFDCAKLGLAPCQQSAQWGACGGV